MKRLIGVISIVLMLLFVPFVGNASDVVNYDINYELPTTLYIGESITLNTNRNTYTYVVEDDSVCRYSTASNRLTALAPGETVVTRLFSRDRSVLGQYLIVVKEKPITISISGPSSLSIGDSCEFSVASNDEYVISCSDNSILELSSTGEGRAKACGMVKITATSVTNPTIKDEIYVVVEDSSVFNVTSEIINIDMNDFDEVFSNLAKHTEQSMLFVTSYFRRNSVLSEYDSGCGFVYKRIAHLNNGDISTSDDLDLNNVQYFEYYFVTNKHIVSQTTYSTVSQKSTTTSCDAVKLYYGGASEISADIVAYDSKIDIAVLTFNSNVYFPTATIGDSNNVREGELVISIGSGEGTDYFTTTTMGIVSHPNRYISDDTDMDGTNDWDAQYIQHDAAINACDCGSMLINLKGEVIGINTAKKILSSSGVKVDNLSFAIPSSVIDTLVPSLEQGIVPERPVIGVTIISVLDILPNREYYAAAGYIIPDGIRYGFYVESVVENGVAANAGILPKDIIIKFNDEDLKYSYMLRSLLGNYAAGSGDHATVVVFRDGQELTLTLTF